MRLGLWLASLDVKDTLNFMSMRMEKENEKSAQFVLCWICCFRYEGLPLMCGLMMLRMIDDYDGCLLELRMY